MKLKTRARYALRMMVEMARSSEGKAISLGDVSKRTHISRRYLDQLATGLRHAALIRGRSGRGGGYELTRPPSEISIGQVIEATIGPINVVECVRHPESCLKADVCECRWVYVLINERITSVLGEISLANLVDRQGRPQVFKGEERRRQTPSTTTASVEDVCESLEGTGYACPTRQESVQ